MISFYGLEKHRSDFETRCTEIACKQGVAQMIDSSVFNKSLHSSKYATKNTNPCNLFYNYDNEISK